MNSITFNIDHWLALSPGLLTTEDWIKWSVNGRKWPADLTPVPANLISPMARRRMSSLSKLAMQAALQIASDQSIDYIVFSSRHGELTRTVKLIEDIMSGEDASPMAFSQSVHNTAAGLFTINTNRATPVTSIAAGQSTYHHAFIESSAYLKENPTHRVLIVNFDEPLPALYQLYEKQKYQGVAFAAILSAGEKYQLTWSKNSKGIDVELPQIFSVIDYLLSEAQETVITDKRLNWKWKHFK